MHPSSAQDARQACIASWDIGRTAAIRQETTTPVVCGWRCATTAPSTSCSPTILRLRSGEPSAARVSPWIAAATGSPNCVTSLTVTCATTPAARSRRIASPVNAGTRDMGCTGSTRAGSTLILTGGSSPTPLCPILAIRKVSTGTTLRAVTPFGRRGYTPNPHRRPTDRGLPYPPIVSPLATASPA